MSAREDVEMRVQALEGPAERPRRRSAQHGSKSRACATGRASSARRAARRCGNGRGANAARAVWPPRSAPARCRSASAPSEPRDDLRGVAQATGAAQGEHDAGGWSHGTARAGGRSAGWGRSPPGRWGEGRAGVERPRTPAEKEACGCAHRRGRRSTSRCSFADAPASLAAVGGELRRAQGRSVGRAGRAGLTLTLVLLCAGQRAARLLGRVERSVKSHRRPRELGPCPHARGARARGPRWRPLANADGSSLLSL